jgi:hypothetical protein
LRPPTADATDKPDNVWVKQWASLPESNREYGVGYVLTDAGQREEVVLRLWHFAAVPLAEFARKHRQTRIPVGEAKRPKMVDHLGRIGRGEAARVGITRYEAFVSR